MNTRIYLLAGLASVAVAAGGCGSSGSSTSSTEAGATGATGAGGASGASPASLAPIHGEYNPPIDPSNFSTTIDNRYFPLKPGTSYHFEGVADNGKTPETDDVTVTDQTKNVAGVDVVVVKDLVHDNGKPTELTYDWYAQDDQGNVWYFGEDSSDFRNGNWVRNSGSWETGKNGAHPGIIMGANPQPDGTYRQEDYPGHAEDTGKVVKVGQTRKVPAGNYHGVVVTNEGSTLEPDMEEKAYAPGVGEISETGIKAEHASLKLISIKH